MKTFVELTWPALLFLIERTDFSEPFLGFGLATRIEDAIIEAARGKVTDEVMEKVLEEFLERKRCKSLCTK